MPDYLLHVKHQNDDYPVCYGIHRIVSCKNAGPDEQPMVTDDVEKAKCLKCKDILKGGRGDPLPFTTSSLPPSQDRGFHGSAIYSRSMRKRQMQP